MTKEEKLILLDQVFSPTAPISQKDFFYGRIQQLTKVADAINQKGQHAILYGERGVGKTSLANIMVASYTNLYPVKITCSRYDDFKTLWRQAFEKVKFSRTTKGLGFNAVQQEKIVNLGQRFSGIIDFGPSQVLSIVSQLPSNRFLFIFDEFDNIRDNNTRELFADLIKSFSDNVENATIVLIGIADNIEELIGNHYSLERCLKQVKMPRMSEEELSEIINSGLKRLGISISDLIKNKIIEFASGFPHYVHLLCRYGAKEIIENEKNDFNILYLRIAIKIGIENTSEQLRTSYQKAVVDIKEKSKWKEVLHACAESDIDQFDCFTVNNVLKQYNKSQSKKVLGNNIVYNLNQLCSKERGEVLKKTGKGINTRFRFVNPMMKAYVKLKISSDK